MNLVPVETDDAPLDDGREVIGRSCAVVVYFDADVESQGPLEYLEVVDRYGTDLALAGYDSVRGVPTTRYRVTVDFRAAQDAHLRADGWSEDSIREVTHWGPSPTMVELWIDRDGLVRRIRTRESDGSGDERSESVTTTELFDYGVRAEIVAPPPDEVLDEAEWRRLIEESVDLDD